MIGNDIEDIGLVPVEAEIKVGRSHYMEGNVDGNSVGAAICKCQNVLGNK